MQHHLRKVAVGVVSSPGGSWHRNDDRVAAADASSLSSVVFWETVCASVSAAVVGRSIDAAVLGPARDICRSCAAISPSDGAPRSAGYAILPREGDRRPRKRDSGATPGGDVAMERATLVRFSARRVSAHDGERRLSSAEPAVGARLAREDYRRSK